MALRKEIEDSCMSKLTDQMITDINYPEGRYILEEVAPFVNEESNAPNKKKKIKKNVRVVKNYAHYIRLLVHCPENRRYYTTVSKVDLALRKCTLTPQYN